MAKRNQLTALRNGKNAELDSRLSDYSAGAHLSGAASKLRGRVGNWPIYAAAAGSALAMATGASANSIVWGTYDPNTNSVEPKGIGVSSQKFGQFGLGPGYLLLIKASSLALDSVALSVNGGPQNKVHIFEAPGSSGLARNFAISSKIGQSAGPGASSAKIVRAHQAGSDFGDFSSGKPGFVGFSVQTAGHGTDYGWLELEFTEKNGLPYELTAEAFGLETDGQPILAGQAPEPGTLALSLLAAGAAGVSALRRRRTGLKPPPK
jgi:PEP-CTERM motif-containing protein